MRFTNPSTGRFHFSDRGTAPRSPVTWKSGRHAAFTLIELLVVVAVIGILAALLLPVLGRAKALAHSASCKSNLRQLGLVLKLYMDDHGKYPGSIMSEDGGGFGFHEGVNWGNQLEAYIPRNHGYVFVSRDTAWHLTPSIYNCPAEGKRLSPVEERPGTVNDPLWGYPTGYGYNERGTGYFDGLAPQDLGLGPRRVGVGRQNRWEGGPIWLPGGGFPGPAVSEGSVKQISEEDVAVPSDMIAFGDNTGFQSFCIQPKNPGYANLPALGDRHSQGANLVFCDGHVEYGKTAKLCAPTESARQRWNNDNLPHPETWPPGE
jgi:prepilin-type N-terminal cleavage/methylation domain-containing protein/prepilin-type processing-associated H-X9-DG protein